VLKRQLGRVPAASVAAVLGVAAVCGLNVSYSIASAPISDKRYLLYRAAGEWVAANTAPGD